MILRTGDIFLTASDTWLGRTIRTFERSPGEDEARVNHVGMIVAGDSTEDGGINWRNAISIEALGRVRHGRFRNFYGPGTEGEKTLVAIYRDSTLRPDEASTEAADAMNYTRRHYGVFKIVLQAADWWVTRTIGREVFWFRRLAFSSWFPICSWLVAQVKARTGRRFGVPPGCAQPDDIWDYVTSHPEQYEAVCELRLLTEED